MSNKIFTVHRNYYATFDVQVVAETEEEAIEKADKIFQDVNPSEFYFTDNSTEVIDTKPADDFDTLFEEAVKHIRFVTENDGDTMLLSIDVRVSVKEYDAIYHESEDRNACVMTECVYVSEEYGYEKIMVRFEGEYADHWNLEDIDLGELDELEQLKILKEILK